LKNGFSGMKLTDWIVEMNMGGVGEGIHGR